MNIQQRIWVGLSLFALITASAGVYGKDKIKTCADLKTNTILKKARPYKSTIEKYARLNGVNADFVLAIAAVETCFNARAVSPVGAKGLMQLMPATAKRFGVNRRSNVKQSIKGGTKYLKFLMRHYKHDMRHAAAAYNAGEGRVDKYKGVPPYRETRRYVKNVLRIYNKLTTHRKSSKKLRPIQRVSRKFSKKLRSAQRVKHKSLKKSNSIRRVSQKVRRQSSISRSSKHIKMYKTLKLTSKKTMSEKQTFQLAARLLLR
ncbi:MAG: lytic transglycosylase domain-containing protein [Cocleimonas sp.]|nr:lytic transglycosylase domain-containing protein [Cocleimonas sp.]